MLLAHRPDRAPRLPIHFSPPTQKKQMNFHLNVRKSYRDKLHTNKVDTDVVHIVDSVIGHFKLFDIAIQY